MNKNVKLYKDYSIALDTILRVNNTTILNIRNIELRVPKYGFCKMSPWKAFPGCQDRKQISLFVFWEKLWHDNFFRDLLTVSFVSL